MKLINYIEEKLDQKKEKYKKWKSLINMSAAELQSFYDSQEGKKAGINKKKASELKIKRGRDSALAIIRMLKNGSSYEKAIKNWSANDWTWAGRQISFISRMKGASGKLRDENKKPTRKLLALKIWGHNPEK